MRTYDVTVRVYVQDGERIPTMNEPRARLRQFPGTLGLVVEWEGSVTDIVQLQYSDAEMADKYLKVLRQIEKGLREGDFLRHGCSQVLQRALENNGVQL